MPRAGQPRLIAEERDAIRQSKKQLAAAIAGKGIGHLIRIIEAGPWSKDAESEFAATERRQLWQFALTYAGDRCGGFHKHSTQTIDVDAEALPAITVRLVGHVKPADV